MLRLASWQATEKLEAIPNNKVGKLADNGKISNKCLDEGQSHDEGVWAHGRERRMRIVIKADVATRQPRIVFDE